MEDKEDRLWFEGILMQAQELSSILEAAQKNFDSGDLCMREDGIVLRVMDPAHVMLLNLAIPRKTFKTYWINKIYPVGSGYLTIDFCRLAGFLHRHKFRDNEIRMKVTTAKKMPDDVNILNIKFTYGITSWAKNMVCAIEEHNEVKVPKLTADFAGIIDLINPADIEEILYHVEAVSDHATFTVTPEGLRISAHNDRDDTTIAEIPKEKTENYTYIKDASSAFSISYLTDIFRLAEHAQHLRIEIGHQIPGVFTFQCRDITARIFLAPRTENE